MAAAHVARAESGGTRVNLGNARDLGILEFAIRTEAQASERVGEAGFDALHERIGLRERIVHAFEHGERADVLERVHQLRGRERRKARDMNDADLKVQLLAHVIGRGLRGFHHTTHPDERVFRVVHSIRVYHVIAATSLGIIQIHRLLHGGGDFVVEMALGDFALHVGILVLHHAGHDGIARIEQDAQLLVRVAHIFLHELRLGQLDVLDRVRGKKSVLHIHERRLRRLRRATRDERKIASLLRVAPEKNPPAAIRDAHHVIMAAMNIERMRGQRPCANMKNDGQPLARNRVEHFLHQHEALTGGEVRHAPARERKAFASCRGRVFRLRLNECDHVTPEVLLPVGDFSFIARAHCSGRGDRIRTCPMSDVSVHPDDATSAVGSCGNSRVRDIFRFVAHKIFERTRRSTNTGQQKLWSARLKPRPPLYC